VRRLRVDRMPGTTVQLAESAAHESASRGALLARGAFFNTIAFLSSNLRGIFTFLVARLLGSEALGIFGIAWATMDLTSKFGALGLDQSAVAFVAKCEAAGDRSGSRKIKKAVLRISIWSSVVVALLGSFFVWKVGPRFIARPEVSRAIALILLAIPGVVLYRVSNALSRGMAIMHHDIYSRGLTESLGTAAALLLAILAGMRQFAPEMAAIGGTLASGLVAFTLMRRLFIPLPSSGAVNDANLIPKLMRNSAPIALYDFLNIALMHLDVLILGTFIGRAPGVTLETVGIYAAAVQLTGGVRKVSQIFAPIFAPVIAPKIFSGKIPEAEQSFGYLARWMLALLLPTVAVFALAGTALMTIFGPGFARGGSWAAILAIACATNAFVSLGETILMIDRPHINLLNSAIALATAIGLCLLLIPVLGPLGAALGIFAPYCVHGLLRGLEITHFLHWRWPWRAMMKPWLAALGPLPFSLLVRLCWHGPIFELGAALLYLGGYIVIWRIIGLDPTDRAIVDHLFKKKVAASTPA
jgi:O-antigen/teichoic acid export membrane protein